MNKVSFSKFEFLTLNEAEILFENQQLDERGNLLPSELTT